MVWVCLYGYSEAFTGVFMREWKIWNVTIGRHWRLLVSGTGSIVLGLAQYFVLGFVRDVGRARMVVLVLSSLVFIGCLYLAFFYAWRDEYRENVRLRGLLLAEYVEAVRKIRAGRSQMFSSDEQRFKFYSEQIEADENLLRKAIAVVFSDVNQNPANAKGRFNSDRFG
jgi:hypothetical protein